MQAPKQYNSRKNSSTFKPFTRQGVTYYNPHFGVIDASIHELWAEARSAEKPAKVGSESAQAGPEGNNEDGGNPEGVRLQ